MINRTSEIELLSNTDGLVLVVVVMIFSSFEQEQQTLLVFCSSLFAILNLPEYRPKHKLIVTKLL